MDFLSSEDYLIAKANGIRPQTVYSRWVHGWSIEDAITKPVQNQYWNDWQEVKEIALQHGVNYTTFYGRMKSLKWTKEEAATTPPLPKGKTRTIAKRQRPFKNITPELIAIAEQNGVPKRLLSLRKLRGWSDERASTEPPNQKYVTRGEKYVSHS